MSIIIPEFQIAKLIDGILLKLRTDLKEKVDEKDTLLYKIFGPEADRGWNMTFRKHDPFKELKDIILRDQSHDRNLEVRLFFDRARAAVPTIHITMPSEAPGENGLGIDQNYQKPLFDDENQTYQNVYTRRYDATYNVIVSSDNADEVLLIYSLLKAMVVSAFDSLEFAGLENAKFGGADLQLNPAIVPPHIFMRGISISASNEISVPAVFSKQMIVDILATANVVK